MPSKTPRYPNLLVAVGASAGGITEIIRLVGKLPENFQATIVFACHRPPDGPDSLRSILANHSDLNVIQPIEGEKLCCTTIYVGSPRDSVEVDGCYFRTEEDVSKLARYERIDDLFKSAAGSARENCVGVILTGMLSDGVQGLKAIEREGGYCIVQDPDDASHDSMPRNALAEVEADFVGTTDQIAERLIKLAEGRVCQ